MKLDAMKLEDEEIQAFARAALAEDVGTGDVTSLAVTGPDDRLAARLVARESLVVAGLPVALAVFAAAEPKADIEALVEDGASVAAGAALARVEGLARGLLAAERTALNILQHLSGIATLTRAYADAVAGTGATLLDTRKTVPGLRRFAKYATALGGAKNHRMGLDDGVLIKDNHIAVAGGIAAAVAAARAAGCTAIEVECDTLDQVREAMAAGADSLLLDNMTPGELVHAGEVTGGRLPLEASGGVTLESVRAIAGTGVDFVSVGRITQSAPAVDIGLDWDAG